MENMIQPPSVIDPGNTWLLPIPKDGFTRPKFSFGQMVMSLQDEACGRIIGMEFVSPESEASKHISCGWQYTIALTVLPVYLRSLAVNKKWKPTAEIFPESDLAAM